MKRGTTIWMETVNQQEKTGGKRMELQGKYEQNIMKMLLKNNYIVCQVQIINF